MIFLDEFESFTEDEYQMLSVLLSSGKDLYIALRMEHTRKEPFSLFAAVQETFCKIQDMAKSCGFRWKRKCAIPRTDFRQLNSAG